MSLQVLDGGASSAAPQTTPVTVQPEVLSKEEMVKTGIEPTLIADISSMRDLISELHERVYKNYGEVCEKLGYAYSALLDAETFLKEVKEGKENFVEPPKMVELDTVDTAVRKSDVTGEVYVRIPARIEDVKYMQSWFGKVFFPELKNIFSRQDAEIEVSAHKDEEGLVSLSFLVAVDGREDKVTLTGKFYVADNVNLTALAEEIKNI